VDIIAGILLLVANIVFALGYAYYSLFIFLSANICFLINSILLHSYFGAFTITTGILAQLFVAYKMYKGHYTKNLHNEKENKNVYYTI